MTIPYYRYVRYTDEGCGIEECLNCKATWEWRGGSGKVRFCMFCGVEFQRRLECRDSDTPRWMHELRVRLGDQRFFQLESRLWESLRRQRQNERCWVLEERNFWLKDDGTDDHLGKDWQIVDRLTRAKSAHDAFKSLTAKRKEEAVRDTPDDPDYDPAVDPPPRRFFRYEYRVRRI
jgi:hypothetical protein